MNAAASRLAGPVSQENEVERQRVEAERMRQEQALRDETAKRELAEAARQQSEAEKQALRDEVEKLRALTGVVVEWSCKTDTGFVAYDSTTSDAIEAGYQRFLTSKATSGGEFDTAFIRSGISYCANFTSMQQTRTDVRLMRFLVLSFAYNI